MMQISTFKLSYFELESGFLFLLELHLSDLKVSTRKSLNICNIFCFLNLLFYTKTRKSSRKSLLEPDHLPKRLNHLRKSY